MSGGIFSFFNTSNSRSQSNQQVLALISQNFDGVCSFQCENIEENVNVTLINSDLPGGLNFTQQCSIDSNCLMNANLSALADLTLFAKNSSNATLSPSIVGIGNTTNATSSSNQNVGININQQVNEICNTESTNEMNNINIFADNSDIGAIAFSQTGNVTGTCNLQNSMSASAYASLTAQNTSASGKKAVKYGGTLFGILAYIILFFVILLAVMIIYRSYQKHKGTSISSVSYATPNTTSIHTIGGTSS